MTGIQVSALLDAAPDPQEQVRELRGPAHLPSLVTELHLKVNQDVESASPVPISHRNAAFRTGVNWGYAHRHPGLPDHAHARGLRCEEPKPLGEPALFVSGGVPDGVAR